MTKTRHMQQVLMSGPWVFLFGMLFLTLVGGCREQDSAIEGPVAAPPSEGATVRRAEAQSEAQAARTADENAKPVEVKIALLAPTVTFEKTTVDFGEIGTDTKHTGQFKFTNTGNVPLKVSRVTSCCGVITRGLEEKKEFAPGEGGILEFDYHASSYAGPATVKNLYFYSNDPDRNIVTLSIKASTAKRVACTPERLRLFLKQENAGCGDLTIKSVDGRPFAIKDFVATANAITAEFDPNATATEFVLKPKADMDALAKNLRGQVTISLTHPDCRSLLLLYDVLPEFTVNPPHVTLFSLKPQQPVRREILILGNYRDEFEIEETVSQRGAVKVVDTKMIGNRCQLTVEITPPAREGEDTILADTLGVKIKDGAVLYIPFRGWYE